MSSTLLRSAICRILLKITDKTKRRAEKAEKQFTSRPRKKIDNTKKRRRKTGSSTNKKRDRVGKPKRGKQRQKRKTICHTAKNKRGGDIGSNDPERNSKEQAAKATS